MAMGHPRGTCTIATFFRQGDHLTLKSGPHSNRHALCEAATDLLCGNPPAHPAAQISLRSSLRAASSGGELVGPLLVASLVLQLFQLQKALVGAVIREVWQRTLPNPTGLLWVRLHTSQSPASAKKKQP